MGREGRTQLAGETVNRTCLRVGVYKRERWPNPAKGGELCSVQSVEPGDESRGEVLDVKGAGAAPGLRIDLFS